MDWLRSLAIDARSPELVSAIDSLKRKIAVGAPSASRAPAVEACEPAGQQYRYKMGDGWSDWVFISGGVEPLQQDNLQYRFVYGGPAAAADTFKAMWKQVETARAAGTFSSPPSDAADNRAICATPPADLLDLANQIKQAREEYLSKYGTADEPAAKEAMATLLWDNKGTLAPALRLAALSPALGTHDEAQSGLGRSVVPDRALLVKMIAMALARDDIEPESEATLELYRKDAEFLADGLVRGSYPLQLAIRRWRHLKRASTYAEIGRATSQSAIPIVEGETVVVYVADVDGSMHVRKDTEFEDGRFQEIVWPPRTLGSIEASRS